MSHLVACYELNFEDGSSSVKYSLIDTHNYEFFIKTNEMEHALSRREKLTYDAAFRLNIAYLNWKTITFEVKLL